MSSYKQKAILKNWRQVGNSLLGNVYAHPNHPDGELVYTPTVIDLNHDFTRAETKNTIYALQNRNSERK